MRGPTGPESRHDYGRARVPGIDTNGAYAPGRWLPARCGRRGACGGHAKEKRGACASAPLVPSRVAERAHVQTERYCHCNGGAGGVGVVSRHLGPRHAAGQDLAQLDAPTSRAALDFGTTFLLHSGAWRAWPAPVEEEPVKMPVVLPAQDVPAGAAPEAAMAPDQSTASMQQTAEVEPGTASPTVAAGFVTFPAPPAANAPTPPTPPPVADERMALGVQRATGRLRLRRNPTSPRRERVIAPPRPKP